MNLASFASIILSMIVCLISFGNLEAKTCSSSSSSSSVSRLGQPSSNSPTSRGKKSGDYTMMGRGAKRSIILSNNLFYKPAHDHDYRKTRDWQINDSIRVLKTKNCKRFILINRRTGEAMKAKILNWS